MNLAELADDISEYVEEALADYVVSDVSAPKLIRDAVYGFQRVHPHEVAILDAPILQRLRGVHQTALSHLVYPSANHSRFEHSVGVATKAEQMAQALRLAPSSPNVSDQKVLELRLAGLLHDVGHGLFSHLTESILTQRHPDLVAEIKRSASFAEKTNLGEAMSALVVRSPAFTELLQSLQSIHSSVPGLSSVTTEGIAELILGQTHDPSEQYLADIISGPFDADKLDYLGRDCHFTGIRAEVDWQRITHALDVIEEDGRHHLAVWRSAVPHLEQILFSKMMLFSAVYHHHKVRALEQMVKSTFDKAQQHGDSLSEPLFLLERPSHIWRLSEDEFFAIGKRDGVVSEHVRAIQERRLLQRSLALNITTINKDSANVDGLKEFQKIFALREDEKRAKELELSEAVFELVSQDDLQLDDIRFDFPRNPPLSEDAAQCRVLVGQNETRTLRDFFPAKDWVASYADNKLTCHVFARGDVDLRTDVAEAAEELLNGVFEFELNQAAKQPLK